MPDNIKKCPICGIEKPHAAFYKCAGKPSSYCIECTKKRERQNTINAAAARDMVKKAERSCFSPTDALEDCALNHFEPFDVPPRPQWLLDLAKQYDVELNPDGDLFQTGALMDCTETPAYNLSVAGNQTGKSRTYVIEAVMMATGHIPVSMRFDKGVDTGVPRKVTADNIRRWGQLPDGSCGNIIGVGKYPEHKLIPKSSNKMEIWIASYKEIREKMWRQRLEEFIPPYLLQSHRNNGGWNDVKKTFTFKNGAVIRMITYEQQYKKTEGEWAHLIILDEEPPDRMYFISAIEHCTYLRLCFTPIKGLGWAYYDCYLPAIQNKKSPVKLFSCSQFDSPFQDRAKVEAKLLTYKDFEVKSRVFGQFSEMAGAPYYTYEITQALLKAFVPRHTLAKILPMAKPETVRDALGIKMRLEPVQDRGEDVWEIYEAYNRNDAYWLSADVAEGNDNPDLAGDASVAYVRRLPRAIDGEKDPVMVAALHTHMRNIEFAWMCLYAACYYNFALMAPETGQSADGAVFVATVMDYPFIYKHTSTNDKTKQVQSKLGFDTKLSSRKYCFDLVGTWIYSHMLKSNIYHYPLLKEINECIVGKGGRPDHPERGSTDCLMAFGISEYVYDLARSQIRNNRNFKSTSDDSQADNLLPCITDFRVLTKETRGVLGSTRGLDARYGRNKMFIRGTRDPATVNY